jgi:hypothetical protein
VADQTPSGSGAQVAGLDVVVQMPGIEQTKSAGVSALRDITSAAKENAAAVDANTSSVDANRAAYQRWRAEGTAAQQRAEALKAAGVSLEQVLAKLGATTQESTAAVQQQNTALQASADRYNENRAVVLQHIKALEMEAASQNGAAAATGLHGLNLGRVNMQLGTAAGRILGVNTAASRFVAMLGGSLSGYPQMIALTAGFVALVAIYDHLTGKSREAAKAQDELTKSLEKWYETERLGAQGKRVLEIEAEIKKVNELADAYARQQQIAATGPHAAPAGAGLGVQYGAIGAAQTKKDLQDKTEAIMAGERDLTNKLAAEQVRQLTNDVAHHHETIAERQRLVNDLAAIRERLAHNQNIAGQSATMGERNELFSLLDAGNNALNPQKAAEIQNRLAGITDSINRFREQASAMGKELSTDQRVQGYIDQLAGIQRGLDVDVEHSKISQGEYAKESAAIKALGDQARQAGDQIKQAASDQVTHQIHERYLAAKQEYDAFAAGAGNLQTLSAARAAELEIAERRKQLGHDLTDQQKKEIETTHALGAELHGAEAVQALKDQAAALQMENDALKQGTTTRETYLVQKQYELEVTKALREPTLGLDGRAPRSGAGGPRRVARAHQAHRTHRNRVPRRPRISRRPTRSCAIRSTKTCSARSSASPRAGSSRSSRSSTKPSA